MLTSVISSVVEKSLTSYKLLAVVLQPIAGEIKLAARFQLQHGACYPEPECFRGEGLTNTVLKPKLACVIQEFRRGPSLALGMTCMGASPLIV
ncbi:MAG: hypothetical protein DMF19_14435 [Verrucomicrobia bacterium]|nr:MAG: hypothetical protein DMF19_14435 [Verrucomicrobiota bacterium]